VYLRVYLYIGTKLDVCVCVYIHIHTHIHIQIQSHIHTEHTDTDTHIQAYTRTHTQVGHRRVMNALEEWHKFRGDEILRTDYASLVLMCLVHCIPE
jgi:hypothetical protein